MTGTVFGAITSLLFAYFSFSAGIVEYEAASTSIIIAGVGTVFLFLGFIMTANLWITLQRTEEKFFPRVQELYLKDLTFYSFFIGLLVYVLYSYFSVFMLATKGVANFEPFIILWIFLTGCAFDVLRAHLRRMFRYSNHLFLLERVVAECGKAVNQGNEKAAIEWMDAAFEVVMNSIKKGRTHVARVVLFEIFKMMETFVAFESQKSARKITSNGETLLDRVNFLTIYVTKRLGWAFTYALSEKMDAICEEVMAIYAKIARYLVRYHPALTHLPLLAIERCASEAEKRENIEMYDQSAATTSELIKFFVDLSQEKNESLRDTIISGIIHLEEIVKLHFKNHQDMNPALLMQPFAEIAQMIGEERFKNLPDREEILKFLKRIFTELNALDLIKQKAPRESA